METEGSSRFSQSLPLGLILNQFTPICKSNKSYFFNVCFLCGPNPGHA
jgi:hypothetical protein